MVGRACLGWKDPKAASGALPMFPTVDKPPQYNDYVSRLMRKFLLAFSGQTGKYILEGITNILLMYHTDVVSECGGNHPLVSAMSLVAREVGASEEELTQWSEALKVIYKKDNYMNLPVHVVAGVEPPNVATSTGASDVSSTTSNSSTSARSIETVADSSTAVKDLAVHAINRIAHLEKMLQEMKGLMLCSHREGTSQPIVPQSSVHSCAYDPAVNADEVIDDNESVPPALVELKQANRCEDAFVLWYKHRIWEYVSSPHAKRERSNARLVVLGMRACLPDNERIPAPPAITGIVAVDETNTTRWLGALRTLANRSMEKFLQRCALVQKEQSDGSGQRNSSITSSVSSRAKNMSQRRKYLICENNLIDECWDGKYG
jgi:hypothetical protein